MDRMWSGMVRKSTSDMIVNIHLSGRWKAGSNGGKIHGILVLAVFSA